MARPRKDESIDIPRRAVEEGARLLETARGRDFTLAEVAAAVGCRAPALYNHFANKDALLRAIHDEGFRRLYAYKVGLDAAGLDPLARLRAGGLAYLAFARENPELYRLMFAPPPLPGLEPMPFDTRHPARGAFDRLRGAVEACRDAGHLAGLDAERTAFTLWSAVHGAASLAALNRVPGEADAAWLAVHGAVETIMALIAASRDP